MRFLFQDTREVPFLAMWVVITRVYYKPAIVYLALSPSTNTVHTSLSALASLVRWMLERGWWKTPPYILIYFQGYSNMSWSDGDRDDCISFGYGEHLCTYLSSVTKNNTVRRAIKCCNWDHKSLVIKFDIGKDKCKNYGEFKSWKSPKVLKFGIFSNDYKVIKCDRRF